jgi:predicted transcriptional regulator
MEHKGEIVENAIRQSGHSLTDIAKKLNISRRHLYNLFEKIHIDHDTILQIGKIINHDFTIEIKGFAHYRAEEPYEKYLSELEKVREEVEVWKNKYITLLEEHKLLLEKVKQE